MTHFHDHNLQVWLRFWWDCLKWDGVQVHCQVTIFIINRIINLIDGIMLILIIIVSTNLLTISIKVLCQVAGPVDLWGRDGHLLCLWTDWIWYDDHIWRCFVMLILLLDFIALVALRSLLLPTHQARPTRWAESSTASLKTRRTESTRSPLATSSNCSSRQNTKTTTSLSLAATSKSTVERWLILPTSQKTIEQSANAVNHDKNRISNGISRCSTSYRGSRNFAC